MKYAFPGPRDATRVGDPIYEPYDGGMTLLDYFAAKACAGICASKDETGMLIQHGYEWIAKESYSIAAQMMKEREKWLTS